MRPLKKYIYKGKPMTAPELSRICGVNSELIQDRILKGWSVERAATQPQGVSRRSTTEKPNCDAWNNDCFRCPLSECNDWRSARAGEVFYIPEVVGKECEYDDRVYRARISNRRYVR